MRFLEIFKRDTKFSIDYSIKGYNIKCQLGEGRYGITYLGQNSSNELVTIKQLKKDMLKKTKSKVKYEARILKELSSLNYNYFPKYIGKFKDEQNRQGYILEYIHGNTFSELLYKENRVFTKIEIYEIALKLLDIVEILESKNIIHKDIRITNVIYTSNKEIKLIDFGLARYIDNKKYKKELDYWYISDFLVHLHYSNYEDNKLLKKKVPWYDDLNLSLKEREVLMSLMGINNKKYGSICDIKNDINIILKELR